MHPHAAGGHAIRRSARGRLTVALSLTAAFMVAQIVGGVLTHSLALIADAGHMATDVGALVLSFVAVRMAEKPPSERHTYGLYRAEVLAALANALLLFVVSVWVLYEAVRRFAEPPRIHTAGMLAVAVAGLVANAISTAVLREGRAESLSLKSAYLETLSDLLGSIGVVLGAAVMAATGWYGVDPIVSAAIGLFLVPRTWRLGKEAVGILLESRPAGLDDKEMIDHMKACAGVQSVHDLHVWLLTSGVPVLTAHVLVRKGENCDKVLTDLERCLGTNFGIEHCTIQVEHEDRAEAEKSRF
ncbi:MAG TPA: cation diffusion facilitator family transporter [Thermoanaerobaculia bacterium]|nr:cation diffusion facilitator family transporter [Thermoanaerobaculia bacterium]